MTPPLLVAFQYLTLTRPSLPQPPPSIGLPYYMAIQAQNISNMMNIESIAKQAPSTIFTSATDTSYGTMTSVCLIHCRFIEYGMYAFFSLLALDDNLVNILDSHSKLTKDRYGKKWMELYNNCDNTFKPYLSSVTIYMMIRISFSLLPTFLHPFLLFSNFKF